MPAEKTNDGLKRVMGVRALATTIVNNTIGAGIYALPAIVALQTGAAGILDYLFCAAMLVVIMLCYAEIGSRVTASGGSYIYVEAAFGPFAGFVVNWLFLIGWGSLSSAAIINVMADSLSVLFPVFSAPLLRAVLFFILLGLMVLVNVRGVKGGIRFVEYVTIVKLIPLVAIVLFGFSMVKAVNLRWEHLPALKTFGETALVLFFAFAGFETSMNSSGEIENPKRTIPRGILLGGGLVFVMYLLIQMVTQGILGAQMGAFKNAPLAAVAEKIVGTTGATFVLIAAMVSCLGNVSGDVLATPRLLFAGAHDGLFPKFLGKVHPRFATPYWAVIAYGSLIFIFSIFGGFKTLAILASGSLLLIYLGVVLAMAKLRVKNAAGTEEIFKVPGGLVIPVVALASIVWMLSHLSLKEILWTLAFIALICLVYFLMKVLQKKT